MALLGRGGMGEVYRAHDTRLGRDVALKVLSESFTSAPDRTGRFRREAQVLASLNHPNIGAIYGFDEAGAVQFLVLELVDGETLADRIMRGRLPLEEALPIARQVADALAAAHDKGIIHRDLKPANIALARGGQVKVLDFGLAKAMEAQTPAGSISAPTITSPATLTSIGTILGTAAYMSPEQARGQAADKRSDIWAFGCLLFEMLSGVRAFPGDDVVDALAAVLRGEPDWSALPPEVPLRIRTLIKRSLEKDRRGRLADVAIVGYLLEDSPPDESAPSPAATAAGTRLRWQGALLWAGVGALAAAAPFVVSRSQRPAETSRMPVSVVTELGVDASLETSSSPDSKTALSSDGALFAFVARRGAAQVTQLYVRRLDQLAATALNGTDGATAPFFSPDGQWVAFFANRSLKKVSATGGPVVTLCDAPQARGAWWGDDGTIVFLPSGMPGTPLWRVPATGGTPQPLLTLTDGEVTQRWPQVLPGARAVLYTSSAVTSDSRTAAAVFDSASIVVQPLPSGPRKVVLTGAYHARYLRSGHLVYIREGSLFAAPFDLGRAELTGPPVAVLEGVAGNPGSGVAQFGASDTGTLEYMQGRSVIGSDAPIMWMDRTGNVLPMRATPSNWSNPRFSPDGSRLALDIYDGRQADVWVYEWSRDAMSRLTIDKGNDQSPIWTPDGQHIVFSSQRAGGPSLNLYAQRADGTGGVVRVTDSPATQLASSWHPGGQFLAYQELSAGQWDIKVVPVARDDRSGWRVGEPVIDLNAPTNEIDPMFSPDGRWLAYASSESGQLEVYVRAFPGGATKSLVSSGGGQSVSWSRTAPELLYRGLDNRMMVAPYSVTDGAFRADKPHRWSDAILAARRAQRSYDLHPDGKRLATAPADVDLTGPPNTVVFIFNFFEQLRRVAPTRP